MMSPRVLTAAGLQALRMSMEEEQARQAAAAQSATSEAPAGATAAPPAPAAAASSTAAPAEPTEDEEEALLKQAIALSKGEDVEMGAQDADGDEEMNEEEAIARAIQMSMENQQSEGGKKDDEAGKKK